MEFVAAGWYTKNWLKFDQTGRNLTSGMLIASTKYRSVRGSSYQLAFMGSCLTISQLW